MKEKLGLSILGLLLASQSYAYDDRDLQVETSIARGEDYICCRIPGDREDNQRIFAKIYYGGENPHESLTEALKECRSLNGRTREKSFCE